MLLLLLAFAGNPVSSDKRRKWCDVPKNLVGKQFNPDHVYTFHIWQHVRSWTTRSLSQFMSTHGFTKISAKATFLEPLHMRIIIWIARKFGIVKRQPPHIIAIYQK